MRTAIFFGALLALAAGPAMAEGTSWGIHGKLKLHSLNGAAAGGETYSAVNGYAARNRPGVTRAHSWAHNDFHIQSRSALPCGGCGKSAVL